MKAVTGVLYAPGTNCHEETIYAVEAAGGVAKLAILKAILDGEDSLLNYQAHIWPGGFSWGDHFAAGRIQGVIINSRLSDQLEACLGKIPMLGICNGFQALVETGLLPEPKPTVRQVALLQNESARFESRWVRLQFVNSNCLFTAGLSDRIRRMPSAHGEGRLFNPNNLPLNPVCYYVDSQGCATKQYHYSPSGSLYAGISDSAGLTCGMMPHPERAILDVQGSTDGLAVFQNLVQFLRTS